MCERLGPTWSELGRYPAEILLLLFFLTLLILFILSFIKGSK